MNPVTIGQAPMSNDITVETVFAWRPCWLRDRRRADPRADIRAALAPLGERWSPMDMLRLDVLACDRLWLLLHEECVPAAAARMLAVEYAREALAAAAADGVKVSLKSLAACHIAKKHASGQASDVALHAAQGLAVRALVGCSEHSRHRMAWFAADSAVGPDPWRSAWRAVDDATQAALGEVRGGEVRTGGAWDAAMETAIRRLCEMVGVKGSP